MNPRRYEQLMDVVDRVMDCPAEERPARVERECGGDAELRREVERVLAADRPESKFLEESPLEAVAALDDGAGLSAVGRRVGSYRLVEEVGRGGMGVVYKAVRDDDEYQTTVAVKLIKRGMDSEAILRRFVMERQILANLNHPNIARLLDGGTTEDGLPYFVMEHVEGEPIDRYCDVRRLSTTERLKLFRAVCSAVSYAHQNLVIHRDLKPSNILITADGTPKLLDFGIAKLLQQDGAATTDVTATELRAMTPEYASPEQIRGERMTTASDVYSLGVSLYELLTGVRPYQFKSRGPDEVARVISEVEPERPSTAVSRFKETAGTRGAVTDDAAPESVRGTRKADTGRLRRRLRGDLDNIVLRALRKEPARRYSSVEQLSEDIRRHLEGLPVRARKDTLLYRARKFAQRNRAGVIAASLVVLALVGGMAATLWQSRVARAERARAERRFNEVRRLANSFMFEFHDEIDKGPLKAKELLVKKALEYLNSLSQEAGDDAGLQREIATAYFRIAYIQGSGLGSNLGDAKGSLENHRKALAIRERLAALEPNNADIRHELASSYESTAELVSVLLSRPAEALDYYRKAHAILEPMVAANPAHREFRKSLASTYYGLAQTLNSATEASADDRAAALEYHRKGIALREALTAEDPSDLDTRRRLGSSYANLAFRFDAEGKIAESLDYYRKALEINEALVAADRSNITYRRQQAVTLSNIGTALRKLGDNAGSMERARRALALYEQLANEDKNDANARKDLAIGHRNLGQITDETGDKSGAAENYRQAVGIFEDLVAKNPDNAYNRRQLALTYLRLSALLASTNDLPGALDYARRSVAEGEKLIAADAKNASVARTLAESYSQLGKCHVLLAEKAGQGKGQWQEARVSFQKSLDTWREMESRGALSGADKAKPDEVARELSRCDEALAR